MVAIAPLRSVGPDPLHHDQLRHVFSARGWLSSVPPGIRERLLAASELRSLAAGQPIVSAGQEGGGPFGLFQGRVGCWGSSDRSGPVLGHVAVPGDWFGHGPVQLGGHRSVTFQALEASTLLYLPAVRILQLASEDPAIWRHIGRLSEVSAQTMVGLIADLLMPGADRRLATVLLKAARTDLDLGPAADASLPLSQTALAELTGLSRAHINRIFRRWTAGGLIETRYNRIRPLDRERLEALASGLHGTD